MQKSFFTAFFVLIVYSLFAQNITHGPVIGGVTPEKARMYIRADSVQAFTIEMDTDSNFSAPISFANTTNANLDNSVITDLTGLQSNTRYYYRVMFDGMADQRKGSFRTFPQDGEAGHYVFVTGSCQETPNMKTYELMPTYEPHLMIHTGDFSYPDYQIANGYPNDYARVEEGYRKRYEEPEMVEMLWDVPIAYTPDNHDNWGNSSIGNLRPKNKSVNGKLVNYIEIDSATQQGKDNCLKAYQDFFPGYKLVDSTKAYYRKFTMGNIEFFMLDTRSLSTPYSETFRFDTNDSLWVFDPKPGQSIVGQDQMNWLLDGLSNSTADWKFVVCGVPFNKKIKTIIDVGLSLQSFEFEVAGETGTGFRLAASMSDWWGGFPDDINKLLNHVKGNGINGVMFISGDTHHNVMDTGENSGLPEINASGLSVATTELAYQIAQYASLLGQPPITDSLWNAGGNGLYNENFKNAFGKIEVFGRDSVQMCIIDEDDVTLSCMTIYPDGKVVSIEELNPDARFLEENWIGNIYPNPNNGKMRIELNETLPFEEIQDLSVISMDGKIYNNRIAPINGHSFELYVPNLSSGIYYVVLKNKDGRFAYKSFVKL
ncbi:MAG: alkaline phosphatase D family protein [Chitinophagales bacterium]